jgi:hypothetical protein
MSFVFSCRQRRYYGKTGDELVAEWNEVYRDNPVTETAQPPFHELTRVRFHAEIHNKACG